MAVQTTAAHRSSASPDAIWALITETDTWPQWHPEVQSAFWISKLVEWVKGSTIRVTQTMPPPWGRVTLVYRVGQVEASTFLEWDARGDGVDSSGSLRLTPEGDGTRITWTEEIGGLKATLLGWRARSQREAVARQIVSNLARLAEQG